MSSIKNYNNTLIDLHTAEQRLKVLQERKESLFWRICGSKGWVIQEGGKVSSKASKSSTEAFVEMINTPSLETGYSLNQEIEMAEEEVRILKAVLEVMAKGFTELKGIENNLYCSIVLDGLRPTEAVRKIAEDNFMTEDNVWRTYYPRVKELLRKIRKILQ